MDTTKSTGRNLFCKPPFFRIRKTYGHGKRSSKYVLTYHNRCCLFSWAAPDVRRRDSRDTATAVWPAARCATAPPVCCGGPRNERANSFQTADTNYSRRNFHCRTYYSRQSDFSFCFPLSNIRFQCRENAVAGIPSTATSARDFSPSNHAREEKLRFRIFEADLALRRRTMHPGSRSRYRYSVSYEPGTIFESPLHTSIYSIVWTAHMARSMTSSCLSLCGLTFGVHVIDVH